MSLSLTVSDCIFTLHLNCGNLQSYFLLLVLIRASATHDPELDKWKMEIRMTFVPFMICVLFISDHQSVFICLFSVVQVTVVRVLEPI